MGGLPSTVTNESIFRILVPVPVEISCHVPEKKNMAVAVTRDFFSLVKIGGPLFVSGAKCI